MGLFNRPPAIAEDTIHYALYPVSASSDKSSVTSLVALIISHVSSVLPNHIWHKDSFELKIISEAPHQEQWHMEGRMRVGDCVDDEWCVVWLLRDISQRWDVIVSVSDSDGEFLLIEAAHHLPAWITPENSQNRLWMYQGCLHLVPLKYSSPPTTKREHRRLPGRSESDEESATGSDHNYISTSDAIKAVYDPDVGTRAPSQVENTVWRRIDGYPTLSRQHLHRTKVHVPRDIGLALSCSPALIQKATEAFYTRDAIQLHAATRMTRFPPNPSVLTTVTMTRTAYAQLVGQKFHPPKVFGPWKEKEGTPEWRWRDVGMKIACGFEMLYQESKSRQKVMINNSVDSDTSIEARKDALRRDVEYIKYIRDLEGLGYFGSEKEGSALWKDKENLAATQFINIRQADDNLRPSFASLVNFALSQAHSNVDTKPIGEDADGWLTVDAGTIDGMLESSLLSQKSAAEGAVDMDMDTQENKPEDRTATEKAGRLQDLANKVERFIEGEGDLEGARFEDDLFSGEEDTDFLDSDDESSSDAREEGVDRTATANRQTAMDTLVPALEPSEYGQMPPSFHSNSQRVKEFSVESEIASAEDSINQGPTSRPNSMRPLIFPRDQFDGVEDSDDESEEGEFITDEDGEDEEDRPIVLGEVEIDMQDEEEEFLKFSREALGISPELWNDIVQNRKIRGAFLPQSVLREECEPLKSSAISAPEIPQPHTGPSQRRPESGSCHANPNLDSFEAVMEAMDAELLRVRRNQPKNNTKMSPDKKSPESHSRRKGKGKGKQQTEDGNIENSMDHDLRMALHDTDDDSDEKDEASTNYTLIKNFLESFKSQGGLSGPVSNLAGRLQPGWQLPRDEE